LQCNRRSRQILPGSHKFAAEALSLQRGLYTEKAEIHAVAALLEIDAACERVGFFEKKN